MCTQYATVLPELSWCAPRQSLRVPIAGLVASMACWASSSSPWRPEGRAGCARWATVRTPRVTRVDALGALAARAAVVRPGGPPHLAPLAVPVTAALRVARRLGLVPARVVRREAVQREQDGGEQRTHPRQLRGGRGGLAREGGQQPTRGRHPAHHADPADLLPALPRLGCGALRLAALAHEQRRVGVAILAHVKVAAGGAVVGGKHAGWHGRGVRHDDRFGRGQHLGEDCRFGGRQVAGGVGSGRCGCGHHHAGLHRLLAQVAVPELIVDGLHEPMLVLGCVDAMRSAHRARAAHVEITRRQAAKEALSLAHAQLRAQLAGSVCRRAPLMTDRVLVRERQLVAPRLVREQAHDPCTRRKLGPVNRGR